LKKQLSPVFIDSNIFFYSIIRDQKYGEASVDIITDIYDKKLVAATTSLVLLEVANALRKYKVPQIWRRIRAILSLPVKIIEMDISTIKKAIKLAERYRMSPYDAAHIIACMDKGINTIISADKEFDKIKEIKRVDPLEYKTIY